MIDVKFKRLYPDVSLPTQGTEESVGYDLYAYILTERGQPSKKLLGAHNTINIQTGICIETPKGYFAAVCSRSGLAKHNLSVCNSPGIIDPDYRGELCVLLHNGGSEYHYIAHGDRVAQLVFFPATFAKLTETQKLSETSRGTAGFGSTGR